MHAALRPYVTAGVALVGASVIAVTPIAPPAPVVHIANPAVRLAAATASIANVPANLINAIANIPANEIKALNNLSNSLFFTGSWWVYPTPTNLWGTDPADPPKYKALVEVLLPFPALSGPIGEQLAVIAQAWLPAAEPCNLDCPTEFHRMHGFKDPEGFLQSIFRVPLSELYSPAGYTFPKVVNPGGPVPDGYGFEGTGPGNTMPWSEDTVHLDPFEPITSVINYLMAPPSGVTPVSAEEVRSTFTNLIAALVVDFNPFVPGTTCEICRPFVPTSPSVPDTGPQTVAVEAGQRLQTPSTPNSGQTFTMNAAAITPDGDVKQNVVTGNDVVPGNEVGPSNGQQDTQAGAAASMAPEADKGLRWPRKLVEKQDSTTTTSTDLTSDDKKAAPGQAGGRHRKPPSGLAGAVKSVSDRLSSSVSKVSGGLKSGGAKSEGLKSGGAKSDGLKSCGAKTDANDDKASAGDNGE